MSRSKRKIPICGNTTAVSEKEDKQLWHRRWRRNERQKLTGLDDAEDYQTISKRSVSSTWEFDKDGKSWFGGMKDKPYFLKLMRK